MQIADWAVKQERLIADLEKRAELVEQFFEHLCFDYDGFEGALFYAAVAYGADAVFRYIDQVLDFGIEFTF